MVVSFIVFNPNVNVFYSELRLDFWNFTSIMAILASFICFFVTGTGSRCGRLIQFS